jgi:hypothetical protein
LKRIPTYFIFALILFLFVQCSDEKKVKPKESQPYSIKSGSFSFKFLDTLIFRNSFASPDYDKTADEIYRLSKSNPQLSEIHKSLSIASLENLGIIQDNRLNLSKFKTISNFKLTNENGDIINANAGYIQPDLHKDRFYRISLRSSLDSFNIDFKEHTMEEVKMLIVDFIPGGYQEILVLRKYYIVNGDNYELNIIKCTK